MSPRVLSETQTRNGKCWIHDIRKSKFLTILTPTQHATTWYSSPVLRSLATNIGPVKQMSHKHRLDPWHSHLDDSQSKF